MSVLVVDASAVVALLTPAGSVTQHMAIACKGRELAAPAVMPFEVANVLRRREAAGLDGTAAHLAHEDLLDLDVELWPYAAVAGRVRELRATLTAYDASYVAVAEALAAPLLTLDARLSRSPGPRCRFLLPPDDGP